MNLHEAKTMRDTVKGRLLKAESDADRHRTRLAEIEEEIKNYIAEQKALVAELEGEI